MRRMIITLLLCSPAVAWAAAPPEGRWEGMIRIPGKELQLYVDLVQDKAGVWTGSIIIPGLGIKGTPLSGIVVTGTDVAFDIDTSLSDPAYGPAGFKAHLDSAAGMAGEMHQGGNVADFSVAKVGPAQVELPARSTAVAADLADQWTGDVELGGYPRHITITFENHANAAATAKFVIVGKQTNDLPVNLVIQDGDLLRVESRATQIAFEGRFLKESGEIRGMVELGSTELPLVLRRSAGRTS
jgi:hypothetical protein